MKHALLLLFLCAAPAVAQPPKAPPAVVPPKAPAVAVPSYRWEVGGRSTEVALFDGKDHVGSFCYRRGVFFPVVWDEWGSPCTPPVSPPAPPVYAAPLPPFAPQMMPSFGGFGGGFGGGGFGGGRGGGRSC